MLVANDNNDTLSATFYSQFIIKPTESNINPVSRNKIAERRTSGIFPPEVVSRIQHGRRIYHLTTTILGLAGQTLVTKTTKTHSENNNVLHRVTNTLGKMRHIILAFVCDYSPLFSLTSVSSPGSLG